MRKLCLSIIFCFIFFISSGFTIKAGISYTVNEARQIAFENVQQKIDINKYKEYFMDINFNKNQELLSKGKTKYKNRILTKFSDGADCAYGVRYLDNIYESFYYDKDGNLLYLDFTEKTGYPNKTIAYDCNGVLDTITFNIKKKEQFIFNINKKLIAHWIGDNCYNEKGELIMTRK